MYFLGRDVAKNATEAEKWYQKAANQGNAKAQNELGTCIIRDLMLRRNYSEAIKW